MDEENKTTNNTNETNIILKEESYLIMGCLFEVYNSLGSGFLESVYQEALEKEFIHRKIPYQREKNIRIFYKDEPLSQFYKADFICFDKIVLELKAVSVLAKEHEAQLHNYLKATQLNLGLLINFGKHPKVEVKRIVR